MNQLSDQEIRLRIVEQLIQQPTAHGIDPEHIIQKATKLENFIHLGKQ